MNTLLLLCLQITLFALISPTFGQDETEVNQNNGYNYQNNGGDYQNNGYIGDGDNYVNNGDDYQNNGDDYQNNGDDYQNNNDQNSYQNNADNPLDSNELQHLQNMRQEMAALNRRLKPPSLRNTHEEFKPQSLDIGLNNGEQVTPSQDSTVTTTNTPTTITEISTTTFTTTNTPTTISEIPTWGPWGPCAREKGMRDCKRKRTCLGVTGQPSTCKTGGAEEICECPPSGCGQWGEWAPCKLTNVGLTLSEEGCKRERICIEDERDKSWEDCPGGAKPPLCGEAPCERWFPWSECQPTADGSTCEKVRNCDVGRPGMKLADFNDTYNCANNPPKCDDTIRPPLPNGNCTKYDYKDCGPTCIRCGCCIEPAGFKGVGEWGCEPCDGGKCEPVAIPQPNGAPNNPNLRLKP